MNLFGIKYKELIRNLRVYPGDVIRIRVNAEDVKRACTKRATVVAVYRHHVLIDFGKYKECRNKTDIAFGLGDVAGRG